LPRGVFLPFGGYKLNVTLPMLRVESVVTELQLLIKHSML